MVREEFPQFLEWFGPGILLFLGVLVVGTILGLFVGYLVSAFRHGPFEAFYVVSQVVAEAVPDFMGTSLRRVMAMAGLAVKEAMRRRVVLVTFVIFALAILFGGWFMDSGGEKPEQIYINFVLWGTQMLVLLMGLLISAFSLPEDIKNKTIYTIVTKPVRSTEIVLGRILGFGFLGTVLLGLMGIISFFFIWRNLDHNHLIEGQTQTVAEFVEVDLNTQKSTISGKRVSANAISEAKTTFDNGHSHRLEIFEDVRSAEADPPKLGDVVDTIKRDDDRITYLRARCMPVGGHTHQVTVNGTGDSATIALGPAIGYFRARQPIYCESLAFYDRKGVKSDKGTNIGKEWGRRGFVDGGNQGTRSTLSRAEFSFANFKQSRFPKATFAPLEVNLGVYRSTKGDIEARVTGGLQFESVPENPDVDNRYISEIVEFETAEYTVQTLPVPKKLVGRIVAPDGSLVEEGEYDLFSDFAGSNGKLSLSLSCRDINQYLGCAPPDVYFRGKDQPFWWNFFKGYVGIWCQMMIIIAMGVALSTFLSTPLVMLGVVAVMIVGFNTSFIQELAKVDEQGNLLNEYGGGPLSSFVRILTQQNVMQDLETGVFNTLIEKADYLAISSLKLLTYLAPDFRQLNFSNYLVFGFAVDDQQMLIAVAVTIAFLLGLVLCGYFCLKTREIAK